MSLHIKTLGTGNCCPCMYACVWKWPLCGWKWLARSPTRNRPQTPVPSLNPSLRRRYPIGLRMLSHSFHVKESLMNVVKMLSCRQKVCLCLEMTPGFCFLCLKMTRHVCLEMTFGFLLGPEMMSLAVKMDSTLPCFWKWPSECFKLTPLPFKRKWPNPNHDSFQRLRPHLRCQWLDDGEPLSSTWADPSLGRCGGWGIPGTMYPLEVKPAIRRIVGNW